MAARQGITEQLVRIKADEQAADSTLTVTDEVREGLEGIARQALTLRQETKDLAAELKRLEQAWLRGDTVTAQFVATTTELAQKKQKLIEVERDLARAVDDTADSEARAREEALRRQKVGWERADLYGDVGRQGRGILGAVGAVGGEAGARLQQQLTIGAELLDAAEGAGKLKQQLPAMISGLVESAGGVTALTASVGAMVSAAAAVVIAWKEAKSIIDASGRATREFIDINREYAELMASGTSTDAEAAIEANEKRNRALEIEREKLQQFIDQTKELDGWAGLLMDVNDALNLNLGGYEDVQNRLEEVNAELAHNANLNDQLTQALQNNAFAVNDWAAAQDKLNQAWDDTVKARVAKEQEYLTLVRTGTSEQLQDRIDALITERDAIAMVQGGSDLYAERLDYITDMLARYEYMARPVIEKREAEAQALEDLQTRQQERLKDLKAEQAALVERRDVLAAFIDESVSLEQERADEIVKLQADLAQKQMDELAKAYLDQAKLDKKYYQNRQAVLDDLSSGLGDIDQDRLDEVRDFNRQLERLTEDHEDNILQIKKNADRDLAFAAARLDAMSIWRIQENFKDQLEAEDKSYQKAQDLLDEQITDRLAALTRERDEVRRNADQRLADLKTEWETERAERKTEAEQRIADLQTQADQRRGELQAQWATEDAERQAHTAKLLGLTEGEFAELLATTRAKYGDIKAEWKTQLGEMVTIVTDKLTAARQTIQQVWDTLQGLNLGAALGGIDLFQTGGIKQRTGLAHLESGEGVMVPTVTDAYTRAMGGSFSQEGLMRILDSALGRGGPQVSVGQVQFPITIGNAGDYSPDELVQIIHDGVRYHFAEMIRGGVAGAG